MDEMQKADALVNACNDVSENIQDWLIDEDEIMIEESIENLKRKIIEVVPCAMNVYIALAEKWEEEAQDVENFTNTHGSNPTYLMLIDTLRECAKQNRATYDLRL